jgi:hypothetical protein
MDGIRWTNSTFWRSGTEGEDHWWLRLAGWQRAAARLAVSYALLLLTPALVILALMQQRELLAQMMLAHLLLFVPWLLFIEWRQQRAYGLVLPMHTEDERWWSWKLVTVREGWRAWEEELVRPVAAVAASLLDTDWHPSEARRWVSIPRNFAEPGGQPVEIMLPANYVPNAARQKKIIEALRARLGLMEAEDHWHLRGRHPRLELSSPPAPPAMALYADYVAMLLATEEYRPFLGVAASSELLAAEMIGDSPHIAVSAGSGAGKSVLTRAIAAQALAWGWHVIILDWKVESHEWAKGLTGVTYVSEIGAIHDMCVRIGEEIEIRKALTPDEREQRPRLLILREEWNMVSALLSEYWSELRSTAEPSERAMMPTRSPALTGVMKLDFAGRAFSMFDLLIAQRMSNRVFNGNTDIRENFGLRLLSRYSVQTWRMLVGTAVKYIRKPKQLGRWVAVVNDEAQQFQAILMTDDEARELAASGRPNPPFPFGIGLTNSGNSLAVRQPEVTPLKVAATLQDQLPLEATGGSNDTRRVLKKLVDISSTLDYLGVTEKMLRNWRDREEDFPSEQGGNPFSGYLYDLSEVTQWVRSKRAAEAAEKVVRG